MPVELSGRFSQVPVIDNVIAVEHGSRLMAGDLHGHSFWHARPHQVSHSAALEIVPDHACQACARAGGHPRFPEIPKPCSLEATLARVREDKGHHAIQLARQRFDTLDLLAHQRDEFRREIDGAPLAIFCCSRFKPQRPRIEVDLTEMQLQDFGLHPPAKGMGQ